MADAPGWCVRFFCADFRKLCRGATQFLLAETRRPVSACPTNYTLFAQHLEHCFKIPHGTTFPNTAHLNNIVLKSNLVTHRSGTSGAPSPTECSGKFVVPQNRCALCGGFFICLAMSFLTPHSSLSSVPHLAPLSTAYCISALAVAFFATLFCGFVQFYYYFWLF